MRNFHRRKRQSSTAATWGPGGRPRPHGGHEQGNKLTWVYQQFSVDGADQKYRLHIGQGTGTPGSHDAMTGPHSLNNMYFTTLDRDNDRSVINCGVRNSGGWWYKCCANSNLNGLHISNTSDQRIVWYNGGSWIYYPSVEMKVRPKTCVYSTNPAQCDH